MGKQGAHAMVNEGRENVGNQGHRKPAMDRQQREGTHDSPQHTILIRLALLQLALHAQRFLYALGSLVGVGVVLGVQCRVLDRELGLAVNVELHDMGGRRHCPALGFAAPESRGHLIGEGVGKEGGEVDVVLHADTKG